ncbi:unnamed protein product [Miscanthus lutarioriparius]|uniref:Glycosyltransferase n=1 Tax=Miscanthus lutarioriparius TaxID=422564 RepID=A0A811S264_9POAL|nr:unnamed protein product [Miscanthus lutarioriparius]
MAAAATTNGALAMTNATVATANGASTDGTPATTPNGASATAAYGSPASHHGANGAGDGVPVPGSGRDHVVIFPFMVKGHMLPLLHFATALSAQHGRSRCLRVTLVTTPGNVAFARSRLPVSVDLVALPFLSFPPLPAGVESTDALPCPSLHLTFMHATGLLRGPFAEFLAAEEVPDGVTKRADPDNPFTRFFMDEIGDSDVRSWGVLSNSFAALDEAYVPFLESFYEAGARAWLVGPLFLAAAGDMPDGDKEQDPEGCLSWLDERAAAHPGSVAYVSFGTQAHITDAQLDELVHGLLQSGHPFLWAVRSDTWSPPVDVGPNSRIVRGWVPQRSVLAHKAVGGFMSHCGWNSVMESLAAGKPMLAWPMIAEQHLNAKARGQHHRRRRQDSPEGWRGRHRKRGGRGEGSGAHGR